MLCRSWGYFFHSTKLNCTSAVQCHPHYPAPVFPSSASFPPPFADCAVCDDGFTPVFNFRCKKCLERESLSTAILVGVVVFVILASGVVLSYLRRVPDGEESEKVGRFQTPWRRILTSLHKTLEKGWPSSALKITVVLWQILSQVHGRFLYLEVPLLFVVEDINQIPRASQAHEHPDLSVQALRLADTIVVATR